ncbi:MAG: winged helix-turn-helix domain-containing protein [Actinomycetota bacterium]|nr:winged helix-turn-helix domain-containing protein [Actinomycetota bacterium]
MEFRVLGPVEVSDGVQGAIPLRAKERRLLAVLLAHPNQPVSGDWLAEALWPGSDVPEHAVRSVQTHVSRVRSALGPAGERVITRPRGYLLRVEDGELDARRFERLLERARRLAGSDPGETLALVDEALALWRGVPYGEFRDEEFALGDAVRLEELRLVALEERIDARLALGYHEEEVGELEARCAEHPLRDRLRGQLMVALYRSGRQPEALRAFQAYRRLLADDLGLDPSPELRDLETKILHHDPELAPHRASPRPLPPVVTPPSSFVGREAEVAEVTRRLATSRLLTLTGPGGVGKTRLALEVAADVAGQFPDGAVVCELAAVANAEAVGPAVATALRIQRQAGRTVEDSVADVLRTRRMLLVVDNCEHVLDAAASLLSALVARCPHVTLLATSRERLAVEGEQVWPVRPLQTRAAVELFCDRVGVMRPDLDCGGAAKDHIVEICERLDGLPLAIELAAAQTGAMNPADLVFRLDDRFRLLERAPRSGPTRHRSLRALVDWSYERLGEPERQLFDRLSVFAGSFTLEAAEEVCAGDGVERAAVSRLVTHLVEGSLVTIIGGTGLARYRLLATLRAYGRERLEQKVAAHRWRERHADYHIELVRRADEGLSSVDEGRWVRRLDAELDELRAAHHWAVSQGDGRRALELIAALHGYASRTLRAEVFLWADAAARLPAARDHPLLPLALGSAAAGAWNRGDLAGARRLGEEAIAAACGRPEGHLGFQALAAVALFGGNLDEARELSRQAAERAEAAGEAYQAIVDRCTHTLALAYSGQTQAAIAEAEDLLVAARALDCPSATAWGMYQLGEVLLDHDPARALSLLDASLEQSAEMGNTFLAGVAGVSAATIRARHADPEHGLRRFPELIDRWERVGNWTQQWTTLRSLVTTLVGVGRYEPAAVLYGALSSSPTAPPLFGADAERLTRTVEMLEGKVGRSQFEAWVERGRRLGGNEVIELARAAASA